MTLRDIIAFPFVLLMLIIGWLSVHIGGKWTAIQMVKIFSKMSDITHLPQSK